MTILLISLAVICLVIGIIGSVLPVLPGVPVSWLGLLLFYIIPGIEIDYWFLGITLVVAIAIYALQIPFAILIGPFIGAFIGEIVNKSDSKTALRAAYGSFIGFLASTFMEFMVALIFFILFLYKGWSYREFLFSY